MPTPYKINCCLFAHLRKSSRTFFVCNYLVTLVLKPRNKPYTTTLQVIAESHSDASNSKLKR